MRYSVRALHRHLFLLSFFLLFIPSAHHPFFTPAPFSFALLLLAIFFFFFVFFFCSFTRDIFHGRNDTKCSRGKSIIISFLCLFFHFNYMIFFFFFFWPFLPLHHHHHHHHQPHFPFHNLRSNKNKHRSDETENNKHHASKQEKIKYK